MTAPAVPFIGSIIYVRIRPPRNIMHGFRRKPDPGFTQCLTDIRQLLLNRNRDKTMLDTLNLNFQKAIEFYEDLKRDKTDVVVFKEKQGGIFAAFLIDYQRMIETSEDIFRYQNECLEAVWFVDFFIVCSNMYRWLYENRQMFIPKNLNPHAPDPPSAPPLSHL